MDLVTAAEMQAMDRQTIEVYGIPGRVLMENAGRGAAQFLLARFAVPLARKTAAVIAGRGNNGGDGFVIARCLAQRGIRVNVYLLAQSSRVKGDAAANLALLAPLDVKVIEMADEKAFAAHKHALARENLWVDAILGTGLKSDVSGFFKTVIDFINSLNKPVLAVDIASGLNSDTGRPCGTCIRATATATFGFAKTGHWLYPGAEYTGQIEVIDIGIPRYIAQNINPRQHLLTSDDVQACFKPRARDAHKGTTGHLLVVAGSAGKTGAAAMTAMAAMRAGAGLVTLAVPESLQAILATRLLEVMTAPLPEDRPGIPAAAAVDAVGRLLPGKQCLAIGPGLGQHPSAGDFVRHLVAQSKLPIVIDADGLNNLAGHLDILKNLEAPVVLTPHPGEMARLMQTTAAAVQQDRIKCARDLATGCDVHVVLKGAATVIAHPDGRVFINPTGNPGMASGGMGDVLTGIIAGLMTQGLTPRQAAHAGVYLHGAAADVLAESIGPFGFLAGEVMHAIPGQIQKLIRNERPHDQLPDRDHFNIGRTNS